MMHCTRAMEHTIIASSSSSSYCLTVLKYHFVKSLLLESRHRTSEVWSIIAQINVTFLNWKIYRDFLRVVFNPCVKLLWRNCLKLALPKLPTMKLESRDRTKAVAESEMLLPPHCCVPANIRRVKETRIMVYVVNAPKQSTKLCFLMYWTSLPCRQVMRRQLFLFSETFPCGSLCPTWKATLPRRVPYPVSSRMHSIRLVRVVAMSEFL